MQMVNRLFSEMSTEKLLAEQVFGSKDLELLSRARLLKG
jgi:hypothetical protein